MKRIVAVLLAIFSIGVDPVVASPVVAPSNVRLDALVGQSVVEKSTGAVGHPASQSEVHNGGATRQTDSHALAKVGHEQPTESDAHAGIAYSVTRSISVGFAYNLEEREDLSESHIQSVTVSGDYENHTLLVRAHWRLN